MPMETTTRTLGPALHSMVTGSTGLQTPAEPVGPEMNGKTAQDLAPGDLAEALKAMSLDGRMQDSQALRHVISQLVPPRPSLVSVSSRLQRAIKKEQKLSAHLSQLQESWMQFQVALKKHVTSKHAEFCKAMKETEEAHAEASQTVKQLQLQVQQQVTDYDQMEHGESKGKMDMDAAWEGEELNPIFTGEPKATPADLPPAVETPQEDVEEHQHFEPQMPDPEYPKLPPAKMEEEAKIRPEEKPARTRSRTPVKNAFAPLQIESSGSEMSETEETNKASRTDLVGPGSAPTQKTRRRHAKKNKDSKKNVLTNMDE